METSEKRQQAVKRFLIAVVCYAIACGLSSSIYSNYFKEAYQADSFVRGLIEIPREAPGILVLFLVSGLGFLGDIHLAVMSHAMFTLGLAVMGFLSPPLAVMMAVLFINSTGTHMLLTVNDSIALSLAEQGKSGAMLGRVKGLSTFCAMLTAAAVFFGFRSGVFSFTTPVILPFAIGLAFAAAALIATVGMLSFEQPFSRPKKFRLLLRREYTPYYIVTLAYGCQKRIKLVFGPWVIVELLHRGADTMALLAVATHFLGTLVGPWVGRQLDRWGVRTMLIFEAVCMAVTAILLGTGAELLYLGQEGSGVVVFTFIAYVLSNLTDSFHMVHSYLMRYLALDKAEVTESLSAGLAVDHVVAITISPIFGFLWLKLGPAAVFGVVAVSALCQVGVSMALKGTKARITM